MKLLFIKYPVPVLLALSCCSCGDDPKLVAKREQQRAEITRLTGEIALIDEKLRSMPPDVTEELNNARKKADEQTAEIGRLEKEITELEARKLTLEDEFDAYRQKYKLK